MQYMFINITLLLGLEAHIATFAPLTQGCQPLTSEEGAPAPCAPFGSASYGGGKARFIGHRAIPP